jgi:hypothetical protein
MNEILMNIQFDQGPSGRWFFVSADGVQHDHVMAVRSFPVAAPEDGIAVVDIDGKELLWIPHLNQLPETVRCNILTAMNQREFMPQILKIAWGEQFCNAQHMGHRNRPWPHHFAAERRRGYSAFVRQCVAGNRWSRCAVSNSGLVPDGPSLTQAA